MKNKIKSIVTLALTSILLLSSCGAAGETTGDGTTEGNSDVDTSGTGGGDITIIENQKSDYTLVRADRSPEEVTTSMLDINNAIMEAFGVTLSVATDWVKGVSSSDVVENNEKEIIIGNCNRKEAKEVLSSLGENEYAIRVVGEKLVIIGYNDYITQQAVKAFISGYLRGQSTTLTLPRDLSLVGQADVQKIALTEGADIRVMTFNILGSGNEYDTRRPYEIQAVLDYLPDVIGFQEANKATHTGTLKSASLREFYSFNAEYHSNGTTANYTPILYLTSRYNLVEGGVEWLNSRYTGTNTKSLSWAVLEQNETGRRFIVVNMHGSLWSSNYPTPEGESYESMRTKAVQWRVDNVNQMLAKVDEMKAKYGELPATLIGDFNFNNTTAAYAAMIKGGMSSAQETATVSSTKGINSFHTVGQAPPAGLNIDHVFHDKNGFSALTFVISTRPDDLKASDHCPVFADLKFN